MLGPASYFHNSGTIFNKNNNKINNSSSKKEIKNKGFILSKFQHKKSNNNGISKYNYLDVGITKLKKRIKELEKMDKEEEKKETRKNKEKIKRY